MVHATRVAFLVRWEKRALRRVHFWSMVSSYFVDATLVSFRMISCRNIAHPLAVGAWRRLCLPSRDRKGAVLRSCATFALCMFAVSCGSLRAPDATSSWYPLEPGNSWIYQQEALTGDMAHPDVERWTIEEKIIGSAKVPEVAGTLVTKTITVLTGSARAPFETHLLIRENCVYLLDGPEANGASDVPVGPTGSVSALDGANHIRPEYRGALLRRDVPADFCFPIVKGDRWGRVATTSPADEFVWEVAGVNSDPFGAPGADTFHVWTPLGSGEVMDRWFAKGIGVMQEVEEHHGTYDEDRRRLLSATIHGKTQKFELKPARTVPFDGEECQGPGWHHFARSDGSLFESLADCTSYMATTAVK